MSYAPLVSEGVASFATLMQTMHVLVMGVFIFAMICAMSRLLWITSSKELVTKNCHSKGRAVPKYLIQKWNSDLFDLALSVWFIFSIMWFVPKLIGWFNILSLNLFV